MNSIISIQNCSTAIIEDIQFENSIFNYGFIFNITNTTLIQIQGVKIFDSTFDSFIIMSKIEKVQINRMNLRSTFFKTSFIEQYLNYETTMQSIKCEKIKASTFIKQVGSQYLTLDNIQIYNNVVAEFNFLKTEEYLDIFIYKNLKVTIQNMIIIDNNNIMFIVDSNEVELKNIQVNNLNQLNQSLFDISGQTINIQNFNCSGCNTHQQLYLNKINGIKFANLNNIIQEQSSISLFELICQTASKIYLEKINLNGDYPQISLVSIQNANYLEINNSSFKNNQCDQDGCVLNLKNTEILIIQDSNFISNISNQGKGGSVYLSEVIDTKIKNSTFIKNKSLKDYGGALYYSGKIDQISLLKLKDLTLFQYNQALKGKGGAIYISKVNLKIESSQIIQNEAAVGGGIYYDSYIPDLFQNYDYSVPQLIKENKAKFYGNNLGSQLRSIEIDLIKIKELHTKLDQENTLALYDFKSGGYLSLENVRLKDEEGNYLQFLQINNLDINKNLQQEIENLNLQMVPNEDIFVQGNSIAKYSEKGFNFNISITSKPMHKSSFSIQSNIILDLLSSRQNITQLLISLKVEISFRDCIVGEIQVNFANKIICEECPDGKYSLDQADQSCKICPNGAQECVGSSIKLFPGYWRANNKTDEIIVCSKNQFSCQPEKLTSKYGCEAGYVGPLCESCDFEGKIWGNRYSKSFQSQSCIQCSRSVVIIVFSFLIFFVVQFVYLNFSVQKIIQQSERVLLGYYLKLLGFLHLSNTVYNFQQLIFTQTLVDHIQVISILDKYNLDLPKLFSFGTNTIGNPLEISNGSLDCIFPFQYSNGIEYWVIRLMMSIIISFLIMILLYLFNTFKINNTFLKFKRTSFIYTYIFYFPSFVASISQTLSCRKIGSKKYASIDLNIQCYDFDKHMKYILILVLPIIALFVIIIPIWILKQIKHLKQQKSSRFQLSKYQFLYADYKPKYYYWFKIKMYFKSIIMTASILLIEHPNIRAFVVNIVLVSYNLMTTRINPYISNQRNKLEQQSIFISIFTINLTFLYQGIYEFNTNLSSYVTVVIYTLNAMFILKLVLLAIVETIPADISKQNLIQNLLYKIKIKFPKSFRFIKVVRSKSFKSIIKFNKIKNSIKYLALLRSKSLELIENVVQNQLFKNKQVKSNKKQNKNLSQLQVNIVKDLTNLNKFKFKIPDSNTKQQSYQVRKRDVIVTQNKQLSKEFVNQKKIEKIELFQSPMNSNEPEQFLPSPLSLQFDNQNELLIKMSEKQKMLLDRDSQVQLTQNNLTQQNKNQPTEQFKISPPFIQSSELQQKSPKQNFEKCTPQDFFNINQIFSNNMLLDSSNAKDNFPSLQQEDLIVSQELAQTVRQNTYKLQKNNTNI
ncbi:hypothetical protein ABPG74_017659 [Tetrahymena malaccensis]